jgi:hypothetical protein
MLRPIPTFLKPHLFQVFSQIHTFDNICSLAFCIFGVHVSLFLSVFLDSDLDHSLRIGFGGVRQR